MGLLDTILQSAGGGMADQLGRQVGLDASQTRSALEQLLPAIAGGMKRNAASPQGMNDLLGALKRGRHDRYLDDPGSLTSQRGINDGNSILGHIFGSKDVSREVARRAEAKSGIDAGILKKLLPMVAAAAMGGMRQKTGGGGGMLGGLLGSVLGGGRRKQGGILASMLDQDGDGSMVDDLLGMAAGKMLGR